MSLCVKMLRANGLSLSMNGNSRVVYLTFQWSHNANKETCICHCLIPFSLAFGHWNCRKLKGDACYGPCCFVWSENQIWSPPKSFFFSKPNVIISGLVLSFNGATKSFVVWLNRSFVKGDSNIHVQMLCRLTWMKNKEPEHWRCVWSSRKMTCFWHFFIFCWCGGSSCHEGNP